MRECATRMVLKICKQIVSFIGWNHTTELRRVHQALCVTEHLVRGLIVLAGWHQGAFGAASLAYHLALERNRFMLEVIVALLL
jgi:hypothetical protein